MNQKNEKHLEFIQNNIDRMSKCSFQIKTWTITIFSAVLALYASTFDNTNGGKNIIFFLSVIPVLLLWILDSFYLQRERKFVGIYNDASNVSKESEKKTLLLYEMPLKKYRQGKYSYFRALFSITEIIIYLTIIVILLLLGFFL